MQRAQLVEAWKRKKAYVFSSSSGAIGHQPLVICAGGDVQQQLADSVGQQRRARARRRDPQVAGPTGHNRRHAGRVPMK